MIRETANALVACVVTFFLCAVAYPAAVWGLGQLAFPHEAEGSLIKDRDGTVIGSELIAQPFASDKYFAPRPSAVDYKADATGGSNLGTKNPDLRKKIVERAEALKATAEAPAPVDLVTASGGGVDPHITPEAAAYQAARVAAARDLPVDQVRTLIERHIERSGAIIGAPARVNVLKLNLALDEEKPVAAPARPAEPEKAANTPARATPAATGTADPSPPGAVMAEEVVAIKSRVGEIAGQIERLGKKVESIAQSRPAAVELPDLKPIEVKLAGMVEEARRIRFGRSFPDDARVWYFTALANGLTSKKWTGETEELVTRGIERERYGTPPAADIDAAFSGLTRTNGKDWLAYYRGRASK